MVCAEKICSPELSDVPLAVKVNEAIYKGLGKIVHGYKALFSEVDEGLVRARTENKQITSETQ
jgi:hypothetical protein